MQTCDTCRKQLIPDHLCEDNVVYRPCCSEYGDIISFHELDCDEWEWVIKEMCGERVKSSSVVRTEKMGIQTLVIVMKESE